MSKQIDSAHVRFIIKGKNEQVAENIRNHFNISNLKNGLYFYLDSSSELDSFISDSERIINIKLTDSTILRSIVVKNWGINNCNISYTSTFKIIRLDSIRKLLLSNDGRMRQYISKGDKQDTISTYFKRNKDLNSENYKYFWETPLFYCHFSDHSFFDWVNPGFSSKVIIYKSNSNIDSVVTTYSQYEGRYILINIFDESGRIKFIRFYKVDSLGKHRRLSEQITYKKNGEVKKMEAFINEKFHYTITRVNSHYYKVRIVSKGENYRFLNNIRIIYKLY